MEFDPAGGVVMLGVLEECTGVTPPGGGTGFWYAMRSSDWFWSEYVSCDRVDLK